MNSIRLDVGFAIRQFVKRPVPTLAAILILAIAIGANTAIFSVVNAVLWHPYPYKEPDRLVQFWETNPLKGWTMAPVAPANFFDWQKQNTVFESMGAYYAARKEGDRGAGTSNLSLSSAPGKPQPVRGLFVSGSLFQVLGVPAYLGRTFRDEETWAGKHLIVILSYGLWQRCFGADKTIVGKTIGINTRPVVVAGIMPRGFYFPNREVDLWAPFGWEPSDVPGMRRPHFLRAIGRLKPGITIQQAQSEMDVIAKRLEKQYPDINQKMGVGLNLMRDFYITEVRLRMLLVLSAVVFVLLVGCANLANLMLAQHSRRSKEISVRMAIGASKWRLLRQFFTENLILSLIATACGVVLAVWIKDILVRWNPGNIPRLEETSLDSRVILFAIGLSLLTPVLFGLLPFLRNFEFRLTDSLKETNPTTSPAGKRTRTFLLNAQVALSLVLLSAAGLMVKSFMRLQHVDPGFDPGHLMTFEISLPGLKYFEDAKAIQYYSALTETLDQIPGVESVGGSSALPMRDTGWTGDFTVEYQSPDRFAVEIQHKEITPTYFSAMKIRLLAGRYFLDSDTPDSEKVVIINQTIANRLFRGENPIGKRVKFTKPQDPGSWLTVVGVVANEKQLSLSAADEPIVYQPLQQEVDYGLTMVVRSSVDANSLVASLPKYVLSVDQDVPAFNVISMEEIVHDSISRERFVSFLLGLFALTAVLLAAIGIYGVLSYLVSQRDREIAVRMAMGARRNQILRMILSDGIKPAITGMLAGFVLSLLTTQLISSLLFQVQPTDPATIASVCIFLVIVAASASYFPAARASITDPAVVLRYQ